jgi:outer membrane protein OmpA-like peptidoglycan-associated protein
MPIRRFLLATVFAAPAVLAGPAAAQPITGLYVGAGAGINWLQESDVTLTFSDLSRVRGTAEFNLGFAGVISLGYGFGNGVRAEIEGNYRENEVDSFSAPGFPSSAFRTSGRARSYGIMANALYDFDLGPGAFVMPYIGIGAGYVWHEYSNVRAVERAFPTDSLTIDGSDGRFAYQAIVGAAFPLNQVLPGLAVTAEYRFMGTLQPEIDSRITAAVPGGGLETLAGKSEVDNFNHSLMLGLRYAFNQPAPPPPVVAPAAPAVAPAPARTFLVFFDWDRADLTDRARQIIAEAAQNAQRGGVTRIEVSGHADRSGTPQYNQRLSERRANAVAAELERRGIARSQMAIQAFGESRPLVPTADGVREPQNRRVEIVLR